MDFNKSARTRSLSLPSVNEIEGQMLSHTTKTEPNDLVFHESINITNQRSNKKGTKVNMSVECMKPIFKWTNMN